MTIAGTILVWSALIASLASVALYLISLRSGERVPVAGRFAFILSAVLVLATSVIHCSLLMTHRFDVAYVYHYSARELPTPYLFATFWAGQEGSFLLWTFWTALLGVVLAFTSGRVYERRVMPVIGVVMGFLLLILTIKSPFVHYVQINPSDPLHPFNGQGLNPLLENPWMVIHPPTLFLGFASLAVTFAYAVSAMIWKDRDWYRRTWPWALFSFSVLGFGVMLGGYWAYETLGWGGFWGWDPVENGPLVPWLGMTAFLHALQVQRINGGLKRTSLFLGFFPFVAALYETFLTRTGILDKFSNHSFSTLGGVANSVILYGMLFATAFSLVLLALQGKRYKSQADVWENASSKEFGYTLAIIILMICAVITGCGMSAPLITQGLVDLHLAANQSSVQPDFYNKANFPVAILLTIGMGLGPYLAWRKTSADKLIKLQYTYPAAVGLTAVVMIAAIKFGFNLRTPQLILLAGCLFALFANAQVIYVSLVRPRLQRRPIRTLGGHFAHIGATLILLGIICLVTFTRSDKPILVQGHTRQLETLPYVMSYTGMTSNLRDPKNDLKFVLTPNKGGPSFTALMPLAVRNSEGQMKLLARPSIFHKWWGDLYIALVDGPEQLSPTALQKFSMHKGQTSTIASYKIGFVSFYVPPKVAAQLAAGQPPRRFPVAAVLVVTSPDGKTAPVVAQYITDMDDPIVNASPEVRLPGANSRLPWAIAFTGMDASAGQADFYIRDASVAPVEAYTIQVSTRPGIGLVWIGTVLIAFGGLLSMRRRIVENELTPPSNPDGGEEAGHSGLCEDVDDNAGLAASRTPVSAGSRELN